MGGDLFILSAYNALPMHDCGTELSDYVGVAMDSDMARERFRYMPALDGMRAVAIVLVVLFHYPWGHKAFQGGKFLGGFLGVDVFFVLSGFLITTLLVEEKIATGRISLRAFYARRALRLFPALVVLLAMAIVGHFFFLNKTQRPSAFGVWSLAGYFANWAQIWRSDPLGPLFGQTWSLAIEEQFYIVFPLVIVGLFSLRLWRRPCRLAAVLASGAAASALWRVHLWRLPAPYPSFIDWYASLTGRALNVTQNPFDQWNRWYFGTDTRLDGLLIGASAAALLVWLRPRVTPIVARVLLILSLPAMVAVGFIINRSFILEDWVPMWGLVVLALLVAFIVVAFVVNPTALPTRVFSLSPLVWIGRRSYAIYLFHQTVYYEMGRNRTRLPPPLSFMAQMIVIGIVAELSWRFIESPFLRRKARIASATSAA